MTNTFYKSLAAVLAAGAMVVVTLRYASQSDGNLSEQCVQALASMAQPRDASVRSSGIDSGYVVQKYAFVRKLKTT